MIRLVDYFVDLLLPQKEPNCLWHVNVNINVNSQVRGDVLNETDIQEIVFQHILYSKFYHLLEVTVKCSETKEHSKIMFVFILSLLPKLL